MINTEFLSLPEFRRVRALVKQVSRLNTPPFALLKDNRRDMLQNWRELLNTVKTEGTREVNIQRYKGLGEMNAEQLWSTTMNAETRTLLQIDLKDFAETEPIFSTLMGEECGEPAQIHRGKRFGRQKSGRLSGTAACLN